MAKKAPKPPLPPVVSTRQLAPRATAAQMAKGGGPDAPPPPPKSRTSRAVLPWEEIRAAYMVPTLSEDGSLAKWPTLKDLAEKFNCSEDAVRATSAEEGWVKQQQLARDVWFSERAEALNKQMAQGAALARMASYQNGLTMINKATASLRVNSELPAVIRAGVATEKGLDIVMKCAGAPSVVHGVNLGVMVNIQQNNGGSDGSAPVGGSPSGNLWSVLVEARQFTAPAVDPFDAPSPLPQALASR